MDAIFSNFYRRFFLKTAGFIPAVFQGQRLYPGDFFQIKNGGILVIGNIFKNHIVDMGDQDLTFRLKLNPANWDLSDGVTNPYSGRGSGHIPLGGEFEFSRQVLAFSRNGSFIFKANDLEMSKILNWEQLQHQLIIKLTQTYFSFREVYVVTEAAGAANWTIAVSGSDKGELEIATDEQTFGLSGIFGLPSARTIQSKDIEYYHQENKRRPNFFKAKKLVVNREQHMGFATEAITKLIDRDEWADGFYEHAFDYESGDRSYYNGVTSLDPLDMLRANELNPNTALKYFNWVDAGLADIEKLFHNYGN